MNGNVKINCLFVEQEGEHYSIRYTNENEIGTYYSEDNEIVIFQGPKPIHFDLAGEGESGASFLATLIDELNKGEVEIDIEPQINKSDLIALLEQKRLEILED